MTSEKAITSHEGGTSVNKYICVNCISIDRSMLNLTLTNNTLSVICFRQPDFLHMDGTGLAFSYWFLF